MDDFTEQPHGQHSNDQNSGQSGNGEPQGHRRQGVVLKFKQRRYDGGSEIDLIKAIEKQQLDRYRAMQFAQIMDDRDVSQRDPGVSLSDAQLRPPAPEPTGTEPVSKVADFSKPAAFRPKIVITSNRGKRVFEALVMGPLEICVALVGMMTSVFAIVVFAMMDNPSMSNQSKLVFQECLKTMGHGLMHCLAAPGNALKQLCQSG